MKIVDVAESYSKHGGGVRTYVHHKLAAAASRGVEMVIVAPGTEDVQEEVEGGRIVWVRSARSPFDSRYGLFNDERAVHEVLDREGPDVVEGSSPWNGGRYVASYHPTPLWGWRGRVRKAFVYHTDPIAVWPQTFFGRRLGFDRVDRLCAPWWRRLRALTDAYDTTIVSGDWLSRRLRQFGIGRTSVVPFGIDKQRFSPAHRSDELRRRLLEKCGVPSDAKLLVAISRLDPEKRISTLIDAFAIASKQRPMGLVIFGRGALEGWYGRKAARTPGVHLHGYVSERDILSKALASADGFLHGSAAETYGLVVAEAICSGVPVIVPDRGGAAALAGPEYAARYRAGDPNDAAEAILRLLARDPARLAAGCRAASKHIGTMDEHFHQLFDLYAQMSGRARDRVAPVLPLRVAS
jgi:alpha-1,6-mannosyltransferase